MKIHKKLVSIFILCIMGTTLISPVFASNHAVIQRAPRTTCPYCGGFLVMDTCLHNLKADETSTHSVFGKTCTKTLYISQGVARCYECNRNITSYGWHDCLLDHSICGEKDYCYFEAYRDSDGNYIY